MSRSPSESLRDEDLVRNYLRGEAQAFDILLKRYKKGIYFLIRQYFPQGEKAEEVFQEVFMKVLQHITKFHASGSFRAWLYTLCRNHCIDRIRYYARRPENPESPLDEPEEKPHTLTRHPDPNPSADEKVYDRELAELMKEALERLPQEQKETFLLKERGGLTFEEIAEAMHVSVNTAKSRMRYALSHLRRILKNKAFVKEALQ